MYSYYNIMCEAFWICEREWVPAIINFLVFIVISTDGTWWYSRGLAGNLVLVPEGIYNLEQPVRTYLVHQVSGTWYLVGTEKYLNKKDNLKNAK